MLTPHEETQWYDYVETMAQRGLTVDVSELVDVLRHLEDAPAGHVLAAALGVGTMPLEDLARRLTLQTRTIIETGRVPR
jgi:hypothetical protein